MGLDQYAYKAHRQNADENHINDDLVTLSDTTQAVINNDSWYGRKINVIQNYMEKTTNIDNCEYVYITEEMLSELEDALHIVDKAINSNPGIHALISKYATIPEEGITHINTEYFFDLDFSENDSEAFGEFMPTIMPDALKPVGGFFYGPFDIGSGYYLYQLTEVRRFIDTVRPWLTDDTFAVYTCWY